MQLAGRIRILILGAVSLVHLRRGYGVIPFAQAQRERMLNLAGSILARTLPLHSTTGQVDAVLRHAEQLFNGITPRYETISESISPEHMLKGRPGEAKALPLGGSKKRMKAESRPTKLTGTPTVPRSPGVPKAYDRPAPQSRRRGGRNGVAATNEAKAYRAEIAAKVKKYLATCRICNPPKVYGTDTNAERHRRSEHKTEPFKFYIHCAGCDQPKSVGYITHVCEDTSKQEARRIKCPGCGQELANPTLTLHTYECEKYRHHEEVRKAQPRRPSGRPKKLKEQIVK
jgi:ribosomal protein S27E